MIGFILIVVDVLILIKVFDGIFFLFIWFFLFLIFLFYFFYCMKKLKKGKVNFILNDNWVSFLFVLSNNKLVTCFNDGLIKIYNKFDNIFKHILLIKEHDKRINHCLELNLNTILTSSLDNSMKIIVLENEMNYKINQILTIHKDSVLKTIKIKNNYIISLSRDNEFIVWNFNQKDNLYYNETRVIFQKTNSYCNILKIKENEIIISNQNEKSLKFYDLINYKMKFIFENIKVTWTISNMCLINNNLLCIGGNDSGGFYLINIFNYDINQIICELKWIYCIYLCKDNSIIFGGRNNILIDNIFRFFYNGKKFIIIEKKKCAHDDTILTICELNNGIIISGGNDRKINFWK